MMKTVIKLIVSLSILIYIIVYKIDFKELRKFLLNVDLGYLVLAFLLFFIGIYISVLRWDKMFFEDTDEDSPGLKSLFLSYLVANFFNLLLSTRFGGDVVRIYDTKKSAGSTLKSTGIVIAERLNGIFVLFVFSLISSFYFVLNGVVSDLVKGSLILGMIGSLSIMFVFSSYPEKIISVVPFLPEKLAKKIKEFLSLISRYSKKKKLLFKITVYSFILQVNVIVHYFFIGKAIGLNIPFFSYFVFIPILLVVLSVPVSINGIGLREGSLILMLKSFSISAEQAFLFAFVDFFLMIILGILGGLIFILRK